MKKIISEVSSKKQQYGDLIATVHDKYGNLLQRIEQPVDSFNRQMWRWLQSNFSSTTPTVVHLNNSTYSPNPASIFGCRADGAVGSYTGIIVGSGTNATTYDTVVLQTMIDHGTSNGLLSYQENTAEFDSTTLISTLTRSFINLSANQASINVNEVGIGISLAGDQTGKTLVVMTVRDVLSATISVPFEATLTVQYRLRISNGNRNYVNSVIQNYGVTRGNTNTFWTNTTGSTIVITSATARMNLLSPEGTTGTGMVFGTSNNSFNINQVDLVTTIAHGNSAGQLFYHPTTNTVIQENSVTNSMSFKFMRAVENRSGSDVSVSEVGLFTNAGGTSKFMFDRKIIDPPVTVTNGNIVTFTWEFCYEV
jgi:hypothetical protein